MRFPRRLRPAHTTEATITAITGHTVTTTTAAGIQTATTTATQEEPEQPRFAWKIAI
jgi:hypothetical protein